MKKKRLLIDYRTERKIAGTWQGKSQSIWRINYEKSIKYCFETGDGKSSNKDGIEVMAEWSDSKREGYSVTHLTILENGIVRFSYDDYGTEVAD